MAELRRSADGRQCSRWLQPADTRAESLL